jgi:hypothetical protein
MTARLATEKHDFFEASRQNSALHNRMSNSHDMERSSANRKLHIEYGIVLK